MLTTQTVHDEAWVVLLFGRLNRIPVVGQIHYDIFSSAAQHDLAVNPTVRRARGLLTEKTLPMFAAVRTVGRRMAIAITARNLNASVSVLPVPVALLRDNGCERDYHRPCVLFVGRLCAPKNLVGWLRVCARVATQYPQAQFEIIGDGPLRAELEARARDLQISVRFHGFIPNQQLVPFLDPLAPSC